MFSLKKDLKQKVIVSVMEKKYRKFLPVFVGIIIFLAVILLAFGSYNSFESPKTCNLCHEMKPYVASYLKPEEGSAIAKHKLDCLGCHTNTSLKEARAAVLREIEIGAFKKITGIEINTTSPALAVNCTRCHIMEDFLHAKSLETSGCQNCHWAHKQPSAEVKTIGASAIPIGPHKNQSCSNCHGTTFEIPRCSNCHAGHGEQKLENALCLACHTDSHVPKKPGILSNNTVKFTANMPLSVCQPCHENEYLEINNSGSQHTDMQTCTRCHEYHGEKPKCSKCHPVMSQQKHPDFYCENCHQTYNPVRVTCQDCHDTLVHDMSSLTAIWNPK